MYLRWHHVVRVEDSLFGLITDLPYQLAGLVGAAITRKNAVFGRVFLEIGERVFFDAEDLGYHFEDQPAIFHGFRKILESFRGTGLLSCQSCEGRDVSPDVFDGIVP